MLEAGTARRKETEPLPCVGFAEEMCDMPAGALVLPGEEGALQIGGTMRGHWGAGVLRRVPQVSTEAGASPRTEVSDDHLDCLSSISLPTYLIIYLSSFDPSSIHPSITSLIYLVCFILPLKSTNPFISRCSSIPFFSIPT